MRETVGAQSINHYNTFRSIEVNGEPAPGSSSGEALAAMEQAAEQTLGPGLGYEWSGTSLEQIQSAGQAPIIFALGLIFVFLVLAAQYESYIDPMIIMMSVPLAVLGALTAQSLRGLSNDVYTQIGLVMLIGLASKNSILIVEFANQLREGGLTIYQSAVVAAQKRMRPIIMTAISTLSSIFPLVIASGAGSASRQSLGTAVFGGMFVATFLSLFVVPVLYIVIKALGERLSAQSHSQQGQMATSTVNSEQSSDRTNNSVSRKILSRLAINSPQLTIKQEIDTELLETMPLEQLEEELNVMQKSFDQAVSFVKDQEQELASKLQDFRELETKLNYASVTKKEKIKNELEEEKERYQLLEKALVGQCRNLIARENIIEQYKTIIKRRKANSYQATN